MTSLTPGERFIRCLAGQDIDRVPFGVWFGWQPWGATRERWRRESGIPDLDIAARLGYDAGCVQPAVHLGIFPPFEKTIISQDSQTIVFRDEKGILKRDRKDGTSMPEFLEYPVKTPADWEVLKAERLRPDDTGRLTQDWDSFRSRLKISGLAVQVGTFPYGVFGTPRDLLASKHC